MARIEEVGPSAVASDREAEFHPFMTEAEPRLRRALVAAYGHERGREAAAEALAYAWEHWDSVQTMDHALGYLYRVGQSRTRSRKRRPLFEIPDGDAPWVEPALPEALASLTEHQRVAVVLVHGFGWTLRETADVIGVAVTTVQNHLERGIAHLRFLLEGEDD